MFRAPLHASALAAAVAALSTLAPQQPAPRESEIASWAISPAVVATFIGSRDAMPPAQALDLRSLRQPRSGPVRLELLVLWRGTPGWFARSGETHDSGGGDSFGHVNARVQRGTVVLDVALDTGKRVAEIAGTEVALGDANVVLVDDVDQAGPVRTVGTRTVDPTVQPLPDGLYDVLRAAPDLIPFLRCDARMPVPPPPADIPPEAAKRLAAFAEHAFDASCGRIQGK